MIFFEMKYFIAVLKKLFKTSKIIKDKLSKTFELLKDVLSKNLKFKLKSLMKKVLINLKFSNELKIIKTSTLNLNVFLN